MEEFKKKREAEAREKERQREREELERERQREREAMERELRERKEQFERELAAAKEAVEKAAREKVEREIAEAKARAEKEAAEREAAKEEARKKELEAKFASAREEALRKFAAAKEAAAKEAAAKEAAAKQAAAREAEARERAAREAAAKERAAKEAAAKPSPKTPTASEAGRTPSPKKSTPSAPRTAAAEDEAYSFPLFERARRPYGGTSASSILSESSYAPSQSTARTTPPPSSREPYSTKDPDKIVIKGVYAFNNAFTKTPIAQLVSGEGLVTDGLILRITTEGLFIDDDVRGVAQREWDVKAWTMKLVEVWCPQFAATPPVRESPLRRRGATHTIPTSEESDAFLANLLKVCKNTCRLASTSSCVGRRDGQSESDESVEVQSLHVLRASMRDQEGKKYVFVLEETEGWKVAVGLQRLRGGTQVRALGVTAMSAHDRKTLLQNLEYI